MDNPLAQASSQASNGARDRHTMLDFALLYAKEGLRVLPLQSLLPSGGCSCGIASCRSVAKHPRTFNSVKDAIHEPPMESLFSVETGCMGTRSIIFPHQFVMDGMACCSHNKRVIPF